MHLHYVVGFFLVGCMVLAQPQSQQNATRNTTNINGNNTGRHIMVRKLHADEKQGKGMVHIVIHKIEPGHTYYKVFNGDEEAARGFTNKIWNRLFNRYSTMRI
ncbi:uncharacterized protein LOC6547959 [Drosophila erecta]|uniref:Uncharacterized protein n=1 Tax=Drosophila erecta TaxID=7220 RepID=B3NP48_DROER|nr:uncharacterized protein LOC6547959 [Drosophila erecta]EDV55687.1 uncharacterized protein Dere_GG22237 [Drosophila erecta]